MYTTKPPKQLFTMGLEVLRAKFRRLQDTSLQCAIVPLSQRHPIGSKWDGGRALVGHQGVYKMAEISDRQRFELLCIAMYALATLSDHSCGHLRPHCVNGLANQAHPHTF